VLRCQGTKGQACAGGIALRATQMKSRLDAAETAKTASFDVSAGHSKTLKLTLPKTTAAQLRKSRKAIAT
jgi:hypothetical protein